MNIKLDKSTLIAGLIAVAVCAILVSNGLELKLSLNGESVLQAVGLVGSGVFVFFLAKNRLGEKKGEGGHDN